MSKYTKGIVAVVGAGVFALQAAITDNVVTGNEWVGIGVAVLTAVGVYLFPNKTDA